MKREKFVKSWLKGYYEDCESEFCSDCNFQDACIELEDNMPRAIYDLIEQQATENAKLAALDKVQQETIVEQSKRIAELEAQLAAHEQAEKDGLIVRLPCKVGDIIYDIRGDWETGEPMLIPHRVKSIYPTIRENGKFGFNLYATDFGLSITEKTNMYYSREAAEAALKEQEKQK